VRRGRHEQCDGQQAQVLHRISPCRATRHARSYSAD
jgi:hypothetical protein